ncbi:S1 family peptidase [Bdellovibrio sp. HCB209]|uniref:S1 family peptidase n=1 Tax=Bdellovibrio sp. HCB209 TaxID=3394354 RepID=UPI0039B41BE7
MKKLLIIPMLALAACTKNSVQVAQIDDSQKASIIAGTAVLDSEAYALSTVGLVIEGDAGVPSQYCTGTLISKNLVVTAAHCTNLLEHNQVKIMFGATKPDKWDDPRLVEIAEAISHQGFQFIQELGGSVNDVAVVKLVTDAPAGFVPVPVLGDGKAINKGDQVTLVGWGRTDEQGGTKPNVLQKTVVSVADLRDMDLVTDQTKGTGACNGDSGGPAYIETSAGLVVAGATRGPEYGYVDCHSLGGYTLLVNYKDFLIYAANTMQGDQPQFVTPIK